MSLFPEYDSTAGFPERHVQAFKRVALQMKYVISSRELNPCCTDLVLEGYAAKGFHIKAKTCDWGPAAGFVVDDYRFIKGSTDFEKQKTALGGAFDQGAAAMPLFISDARFNQLKARKIVAAGKQTADRAEVSAFSEKEKRQYKFVLVKANGAPGGTGDMWGIYYDPAETAEPSAKRVVSPLAVPLAPGLTPLMGMVNPENRDGARLGVRSAVAGDYDLWCVFPHSGAKDHGINDRPMPLKATLPQAAAPGIRARALQAGVVYDNKTKATASAAKENPHLGNFSLGIMKVKNALNHACSSAGYGGGNIVQHSDYGGNPFGEIDYPLIFFVPNAQFSAADAMLVNEPSGLKRVLKEIDKRGFIVKLNPAWTVPNF